MSTLLNNYTVILGGDQYTLVSDEGSVSVEKLALHVNITLAEIAAKTGCSVDSKRCAILAAVKCAHQMQKIEYELQKKTEESLLIEKINQQLSDFVS